MYFHGTMLLKQSFVKNVLGYLHYFTVKAHYVHVDNLSKYFIPV